MSDDTNDVDVGGIEELIAEQAAAQGVSIIRASDGHVITFTHDMLTRLLAVAEDRGLVVIFVRHGAQA